MKSQKDKKTAKQKRQETAARVEKHRANKKQKICDEAAREKNNERDRAKGKQLKKVNPEYEKLAREAAKEKRNARDRAKRKRKREEIEREKQENPEQYEKKKAAKRAKEQARIERRKRENPEEFEEKEQARKDKNNAQRKARIERRKRENPEEFEEKEQARKDKEYAQKKARIERHKREKEANPKGYVSNEADWLLTDDFFNKESKKSIVSDGRYRDEKGRHYLGRMDQVCVYCGALGFEAENKGTKEHCHFGSLCCHKGKVKGIKDYNLPQTLQYLYTSNDDISKFFRKNARVCNNAFAMSSLTCTNKWQTRTHNNAFECMLTAQGQLLRRIGPLLPPVNGTNPKCIQAYFFGGENATKWRIKNGVKNNITEKERENFNILFPMLQYALEGESQNNYLRSFISVKEYVERELQGRIYDVKLAIHATQSAESLHHEGRLNAPVFNEIAILMPESDDLTKFHNR